jgi:hypothetical protein
MANNDAVTVTVDGEIFVIMAPDHGPPNIPVIPVIPDPDTVPGHPGRVEWIRPTWMIDAFRPGPGRRDNPNRPARTASSAMVGGANTVRMSSAMRHRASGNGAGGYTGPRFGPVTSNVTGTAVCPTCRMATMRGRCVDCG